MSRLGLFAWMAREGVAKVIEGHKRALSKDHDVRVFDFAGDLPDDPGVDLAVVFGGDGTILGAARYLAPRGVPAIGLNLGKFGFLAGCVGSECGNIVGSALSGRIQPVDRTMLSCSIGGQGDEKLIALNDIAVTPSVPTQMIELEIAINDVQVSTFQGDGLIVATATGSTAYNLSSGGPLVTPTEDVIILTALAPHTLSVRPMVISGSDVVDVVASNKQGNISVTADGQVARVTNSAAAVRVERAPFVFRLYESEDWSFYKVVRSKLRWGEEPNYVHDSD